MKIDTQQGISLLDGTLCIGNDIHNLSFIIFDMGSSQQFAIKFGDSKSHFACRKFQIAYSSIVRSQHDPWVHSYKCALPFLHYNEACDVATADCEAEMRQLKNGKSAHTLWPPLFAVIYFITQEYRSLHLLFAILVG